MSICANAETITGRVVGVADGDTVTVLDAEKVQHKIRLAGIDAPEKSQAFGSRSKESLSDLTFDKTVTVETSKRDRYGREVGKILVNGRDVNLVQVERGMAWHYRAYDREQSPDDRKSYDAAEMGARAARRACGAMQNRHRHGTTESPSAVAKTSIELPGTVDDPLRSVKKSRNRRSMEPRVERQRTLMGQAVGLLLAYFRAAEAGTGE